MDSEAPDIMFICSMVDYCVHAYIEVVSVVSSRLSQVTPFIAIAQLNFIKESTSYIHNTILGISNTTFT